MSLPMLGRPKEMPKISDRCPRWQSLSAPAGWEYRRTYPHADLLDQLTSPAEAEASPALTLITSFSCFSLFSPSLALSLSLLSSRGSAIPLSLATPSLSSTPRPASFTHHPALDAIGLFVEMREWRRRERTQRVRSLSPSTTPDAGPQPAKGREWE